MPSKKIIIIGTIILFNLLTLSGGVFAYYKYSKKGSVKPTANHKEAKKEETQTTERLVNSSSDCGKDMQCFIVAAKNCKPSKVINTATLEGGEGFKQVTTSTLSIKGKEADKCLFYIRTDKLDLTLPANTPQESANQQKVAYKSLEGRNGTCKFQTADLTAMLTRWDNGELSTEDYKKAECTGTFFDNQL